MGETMSPEESFLEAVIQDDDERLRALLDANPALAAARDEQGVSAPMLALYHRKLVRAESLAKAKEAIEPLDVFEASAFGRVERLREILALEPALSNAHAKDGFFPLGLAAFFSRERAVEALLEAGADPDLAANNPTKVRAIHAACAAGNLAIVRAVLEAGGDVNAAQQNGFTPLHAAAMSGNLELVQLLAEHGADRALEADDGRTPVDMAREAKQDAVVSFLTEPA